MFPNNWLETSLALFAVLAIAALMKYFRYRPDEAEDEIDYSDSATEPGPVNTQPLPKGFGTAKNHPHNRE